MLNVEEYFQEDREFFMVLELPMDIKDEVGSGSLVILTWKLREEKRQDGLKRSGMEQDQWPLSLFTQQRKHGLKLIPTVRATEVTLPQ